MKIIDELKSDFRVEEAYRDGDGYWAPLKPGWQTMWGTHTIHEMTATECREQLRALVPCGCQSCEKGHQ